MEKTERKPNGCGGRSHVLPKFEYKQWEIPATLKTVSHFHSDDAVERDKWPRLDKCVLEFWLNITSSRFLSFGFFSLSIYKLRRYWSTHLCGYSKTCFLSWCVRLKYSKYLSVHLPDGERRQNKCWSLSIEWDIMRIQISQ